MHEQEPGPRFSDTVQDVAHFLRHPQLPEVRSATAPLKVFLHLLVLSLLLGFGVVMLLGALQKAGVVPELPHAMDEVLKTLPIIVVLLLAAVLMPVLEELAFRLWLVNRLVYFGISLWLSAIFLYSSLSQVGATLAGYGVLALATLITILLLTFKEASQALMDRVYQYHYGWVFYGATVLFALLHLINFQINLRILLLAPILVLPQLLLGLVLGYLRVRQGIGWAMVLHGLYNAIILSLAYSGMQMEAPAPPTALLPF